METACSFLRTQPLITLLMLVSLNTTHFSIEGLVLAVLLGGIVFTSEIITLRFGESSSMILGGISLVVLGRYYFVQSNAS